MVSMIGLLATSRRSPMLLRFYAFMLVLAFIVLLGGVACSLRVIFTIHVGVNHSLAIPLIRNYGKDSAATSAWDNLHGNGLWFWPLSQYLQGVLTSFSENQYFEIFHQNEKFRQIERLRYRGPWNGSNLVIFAALSFAEHCRVLLSCAVPCAQLCRALSFVVCSVLPCAQLCRALSFALLSALRKQCWAVKALFKWAATAKLSSVNQPKLSSVGKAELSKVFQSLAKIHIAVID